MFRVKKKIGEIFFNISEPEINLNNTQTFCFCGTENTVHTQYKYQPVNTSSGI